MQNRMNLKAIKMVLPLLLIALSSCATRKVDGLWRDDRIVADGYDNEWSGSPQYIDEDRRLIIRVTNDGTTISLCVATSRTDFKRTLQMAGLDLWFDPQGGKKQVFGIHLPGGEAMGPQQPPGREAAVFGPRDSRGGPPENELPSPAPPKELAVSYADATGPLTMTIAEVRRTGIDIGVGRPAGGRLVYEFVIAVKAAPSLCDLKPGMVVGIGILTGTRGQGGPNGIASGGPMVTTGFSGGLGGPGPGGGMGGGPGGRDFPKRDKPLEVWLQVRLAQPPVG